jgi:hypothetical protein
LFLSAAALNGINIGLRHILPVYPFLILLAGFFFSQVLNGTKGLARKVTATIMAILFIFSVGRVLVAAPDYLSYFNEFVRGPEHGAKLVADSNLNWGQDNARLAQFAIDKQISSIKIRSEAENADVYNYYRLNWSQASEQDLTQPSSGFYAIGIGIYASLQKNPNSWFMGKKPLYIIGKTIYIFEVPSNNQDSTTSDTAGTR